MEENKDLRKKKLEKIYSVGIHKHKGNKHIKSDTYGEITWKGVNQIISCLDLEETKDLVFPQKPTFGADDDGDDGGRLSQTSSPHSHHAQGSHIPFGHPPSLRSVCM